MTIIRKPIGVEYIEAGSGDGYVQDADGVSHKTRIAGVISVLLKNTSIVLSGAGDGGAINFSIASGEVANLGDVTPFDLPYSNVLVTKTGTNAIATATWGVSTGGMLFISISAMHALDAINITGVTPTGNTVVGNIYYRSNGGAPTNVAIAGPAFITIYNGR